MGYRSQVVLAISKHLVPFLLLATSKNKATEELVFKDTDTFNRDYCHDKSFEVDGELQSSAEHIRFVYVGEDAGNVEVMGDAFWDIHPHTQISY